MKTIISAEKETINLAAEHIKGKLQEKSDTVLALCCGRSVRGLYARLLDMYSAGELSFSQARIFALTEFLDAPYNMSSRKQIYDDYFSKTDLKPENFIVPDVLNPEHYDALIENTGGIDLAVLGIGENGHIGYNEPATPFASMCHVQKLTDATRRQLEKLHESRQIPERAFTMGIKTITQARDIVLLAFSEEKSQAVHKMLYGRNDSAVPAAFLQIPLNVTLYLDEEASSQL